MTNKATLRPLKQTARRQRKPLTREQRHQLMLARRLTAKRPAPCVTTYTKKVRLEYAPITTDNNGHHRPEEVTLSWRDADLAAK